MVSKLAALLCDADLPASELSAAVLDGETFPVGDWFAPVDSVYDPTLRAHALSELASLGVLAGMSAAWVYGACPPPVINEVTTSQRVSGLSRRTRLIIHEAKMTDDDIVRFGGVAVTAPLRTAIDLALAQIDAEQIDQLLRITGVDPDDCLARLAAESRIPGIRCARETFRLLTARAASPT